MNGVQAPRNSIPGLTGLRFLLAMDVVINHGAPLFPARGLPDPWWRLTTLAHNTVVTGFTAVDGFFVLSGFVLAYSYLPTEVGLTVSRHVFYLARAARILPVYLLALAISVLLGIFDLHGGIDIATLARSLTLTQAWWRPVVFSYNPPGWTLSVEVTFYLVFPFLSGPVSRLRRRTLLAALPVLWGVVLVADTLYDRVWPFDEATRSLVYHPANFMPAFVMGMMLGRLYLLRCARLQVHAGTGPNRLLLLATCLMFVVMATAPWRDGTVYHGYLLPLWCIIVYQLAAGESHATRLLAHPLMVRLGEASYAMYLLHWPLSVVFERIPIGVSTRDGHLSGALFIPYVILLIGVSLAAYLVVEQPARRSMVRALSRPRKALATPAVALGHEEPRNMAWSRD